MTERDARKCPVCGSTNNYAVVNDASPPIFRDGIWLQLIEAGCGCYSCSHTWDTIETNNWNDYDEGECANDSQWY